MGIKKLGHTYAHTHTHRQSPFIYIDEAKRKRLGDSFSQRDILESTGELHPANRGGYHWRPVTHRFLRLEKKA